MVVGNKTLSGISVNYKLPGNLRLHHAQAASLKASVKVQADVFEAYVGGVYLDRGIEVARSWIYALFEPYIRDAYRIVREQHGLPPPSEPALPSPISPDITYSGVWDPTPPAAPYASRNSSTSGTSDEDTPPLGRASTANNQATGHLALLNQRIQQLHKSVEWSYSKEPGPGTRTTPRWKAVCIVGDRPIAEGLGTTKKAAQNAAAKDGLMNLGVSVE